MVSSAFTITPILRNIPEGRMEKDRLLELTFQRDGDTPKAETLKIQVEQK